MGATLAPISPPLDAVADPLVGEQAGRTSPRGRAPAAAAA